MSSPPAACSDAPRPSREDQLRVRRILLGLAIEDVYRLEELLVSARYEVRWRRRELEAFEAQQQSGPS